MSYMNDISLKIEREKEENQTEYICTEDMQECDKCPRTNCIIKTLNKSVKEVKVI